MLKDLKLELKLPSVVVAVVCVLLSLLLIFRFEVCVGLLRRPPMISVLFSVLARFCPSLSSDLTVYLGKVEQS